MDLTYNVVLIDDETGRHEAWKKVWKEVFSYAGIQAAIQTYSDFELDLDTLSFRPHFVIVDNVLEVRKGNRTKEEENRGIEFIAAYKEQWQDAIFILATKETFNIEVLGQKYPNPDLLVPKTALSSNSFRERLGGELAKKKIRSSFGRLNIPDPTTGSEVEPIREKLTSVLEQCIHSVAQSPDAESIQQINLESLAGGFSGSKVFKAKMFDSSLRSRLPLVVKVSEGEGALREAKCYNSFARLQLPHDMRVDLLGYGEAGDLRGALYAFAVGSADDLTSLSELVGKRDYDLLDQIIDRFFLSSQIGWYKAPKSVASVENWYGDSEEYSHEKDATRLSELKSYCSENFEKEEFEISPNSMRIGKFRFKFVRKFLEPYHNHKVDAWTCHGDFNTNNIILGRENTALSVIDFEYSGPDSVYKDFVSLECSFRIDDAKDAPNKLADIENLVTEELELLRSFDSFDSSRAYLNASQKVRVAAKSAIEREGQQFDVVSYNLALAFHLFKLLGIAGLADEARSQLLCAFVATSKWLDTNCQKNVAM